MARLTEHQPKFRSSCRGAKIFLCSRWAAGGEEQFILCRSRARGQKEAAMLARQSAALCEELAKLDRALAHKPQGDLEAVGRRIGRWLGRYRA